MQNPLQRIPPIFRPCRDEGDSAAPDAAGGMVHTAFAGHAAADSLSLYLNSCAAAFLS
ncbi:MAG: hypothetical protein IKQ75_01975 [Bacteroidales bacterium]|nr:hypothetical protein [Bacteroidales bacterium]